MSLRITEKGLEVRAPKRTSLAYIEGFIKSKEKWIRKHLDEQQRCRRELGTADNVFSNGGKLRFRGKFIELKMSPGSEVKLLTSETGDELLLPLNPEATESEIRNCVLEWMIREAKQVIGSRYEVVAQSASKRATRWRLSNARSQWGSCSSDGSMRFSWRLVFFEDDVIDYVIAHELAHRVHMNHSSQFWKTVECIMPSYKESKKKLKGILIKNLPL